MHQNIFFSIYDELRELALFTSDISAAISCDSIYIQIFKGSELVMENGGNILPAFDAIASGSGLHNYNHPSFGYFLSAIAHEVFVYGNIGLVTDVNLPDETRFRLISSNFQHPEHPNRAQFDKIYKGITSTLIQRGSCKLEDGYGEPYLFPALSDFKELKQTQTQIIRLLDNVHNSSSPQSDLDQLTEKKQYLRQKIVTSIGLEYQKDDTHHFSNQTKRQLAIDVCQIVTENILQPIANFQNINELPIIDLP